MRAKLFMYLCLKNYIGTQGEDLSTVKEPPIICYKYNKPIRNTVFNFNKLVSDLDIHANTPES